jgi:hypothetical protein
MPMTADPLAVVVDWLDCLRQRALDDLVRLYDDGAVLECACDGRTHHGHAGVAQYWAPKLEKVEPGAFRLDEIVPTDRGVSLVYRSFEGKPVRARFVISDAGAILHTVCEPRCAS